MDHNLRCHPVLAREFSERCCVLDQSRASKKIWWFIIKVITLAQGSNFPAKGGWRGGMVKLRIDRRISICSRYLTVASGINFLGQVATSAEQWDKKRFLQDLHRSPCSTGIFLWKLLCLIVIKLKRTRQVRLINSSCASQYFCFQSFRSLTPFPVTSVLSFFFHRIPVLTILVWMREFVK